ncbi:MAG: hypothetical protein ACRDGL_08015 [Candidatus Limnocylindrales bacterium]
MAPASEPDVATSSDGEAGAGHGSPALVDPGPHDLLLAVLTIGLVGRGLLGLADAWSLSTSGIRFIGLDATMSLGGGSIGWTAGWGAAALVAGLLLARRQALAWLLAVAACVAYLVTGIGEAVQIVGSGDGGSGPAISTGAWLFFLVDLTVPALLLALLFTVRPWFLSVSRSRSGRR